MKAVLLVSHGSRSIQTKREVRQLLSRLKPVINTDILKYAFLEIERPSIPEAIDQCVKKGAQEIIILLNFLNAGRHVDEDIPEIIRKARQKHKNVQIISTIPVGQHPRIVHLFAHLVNHIKF